MNVKLYIGNLSANIGEDELRGLFSQAGTVTSVALINDRATGMSKGLLSSKWMRKPAPRKRFRCSTPINWVKNS